MGVKSTVRLTRDHAEGKIVELWQYSLRAAMFAKARAMSDVELENALEKINDKANYGEGFENYLITEDGE